MAAAITTTRLSRPVAKRGSRRLPDRGAKRLFESGRPTLDDRIVATWARLTETGRAPCPVCAGELVAGAGCDDCGSELS